MSAENVPPRGNGFIISGGAVPPPTTVKVKCTLCRPNAFEPAREAVRYAFDAAGAAFFEYSSGASDINRRFFRKTLSLFVAACSLAVFFKFFTFASVVYKGKECISVVASENAYKNAVNTASKLAASEGIDNLPANYRLAPAIVLRSHIDELSVAADKLLLSDGAFANAYTLISDGKAVYNAKTHSEAKQVLSQYIKRLSLGGKAEVRSKTEIRKRILAKKDIMSKEDCSYLLDAGGLVSVVTVTDSAVEKAIPFETKAENDDSLFLGEKVTLSEGSEGRAQILQQTVYENGVAQNVSVVAENVSAEPVARIVKVGTKEKEVLKTGLLMPVSGRLSSKFGKRWGKMHEGIDIAVSTGTPVKAAECGRVSFTSENAGGYGKFVKINHGYGVETAYGHLSEIVVKKGDVVAAGAEIAKSGNTGRSTGPHLHFEIIKDGAAIDPLPHLKK